MPHSTRRSAIATLALLGALAGCGGEDSAPEPGPATPPAPATADWPQWRGPGSHGIADGSTLPARWASGSSNVRFRTELPGTANSSPIVVAGRAIVTSAEADEATGEVTRAVSAVDLDSGSIVWTTVVDSAPPEKLHALSTYAMVTPATDGVRVYAYFGSLLAALDLDGAVVWRRDVDPDYLRFSRYGAAASPIVAGELVVLMQDREFGETPDRGWLAAWHRTSGEPAWRTEWEHTCCSYSPPHLLALEPPQLVLFHSGEVAGYDLASGTRLWSEAQEVIQPVPSVVSDGDLVIASGGTHVRTTLALRVAGSDGGVGVERLWESTRGIPSIASPVLYRGRLFSVTDEGVLSATDPLTGDTVWRRRIETGTYRASLLAGDGKVYAASTHGVVTVVDADAKRFRLLAENAMDEAIDASPAVGGGCLLLRTAEALWCIEPEAAGSGELPAP